MARTIIAPNKMQVRLIVLGLKLIAVSLLMSAWNANNTVVEYPGDLDGLRSRSNRVSDQLLGLGSHPWQGGFNVSIAIGGSEPGRTMG